MRKSIVPLYFLVLTLTVSRQVERQVHEAIGRVDDGQPHVGHGLSRRRTLATIQISATNDPVLKFYQSGPMVRYPCRRAQRFQIVQRRCLFLFQRWRPKHYRSVVTANGTVQMTY